MSNRHRSMRPMFRSLSPKSLRTVKRVAIRAVRRLAGPPGHPSDPGLRSRGLLVRLATVSAMVISPPLLAASEASTCGPSGGHVFETASYYHGAGRLSLDEDQTVQLVLEPAERDRDVELFRIAFFREAGPFDAGLLPEDETPVPITVLERRATWYHEIELFVDDARRTTLTFFVDSGACTMTTRELEHYLNNQIYPAAALWRSTLPSGTPLDSPEVREGFEHPLLVSEPKASTQAVLWCQSGGPGATSCSIDFGGIGPISAGGCSISCVPPLYACCGPGFGRNCECRAPDSGGGGGGWLPPWWPGPGDDDDDDDDPEEDGK